MSLPWTKRKTLLSSLLNSSDDDEEGLALDRILHGQQVIGRTEIESLRFSDGDLITLGALDNGQFGVIDVVTCQLNGSVYVRKSIEKHFALRTREQCSPQLERDILLRAKRESSSWAPHLLCAFQTSTHLNLVMDYAEGGTLWDVLESSPYEGRVPEADILWWAPQAICAIDWCHSQGFVHRDIKPQNFVLKANNHMLLIDFGSAAPLSPPELDGSQLVAKRYTLVPCGTCDYISPEVLQAHEDALLELELSDDCASSVSKETGSYGLEVDWWSLGAMLYELAYGVAPFFANDIRTTYLRILDHETSLRFNKAVPVSKSLQDLLRRHHRLGRCSVLQITEHPFFENTDWSCIDSRVAPSGIHVPQFTYSTPAAPVSPALRSHHTDEENSQPFAFSALFQSSSNTSPEISVLRDTSHGFHHVSPRAESTAFIGFSWGPSKDAFSSPNNSSGKRETDRLATPQFLQANSVKPSPYLSLRASSAAPPHFSTFATPVRPHNLSAFHTLPRTSTIRRTAQRRAVSDREAMKQLVECIGMSARKKVLASGRKPRLLQSLSRSFSNTVRKELRFGPQPIVTNKTYCSDDFPPVVVASTFDGADETESDGPPSPSPSPRPGSAMSILSRRSVTPTITGSYSARLLSLPSATLSREGLFSDLRGEENIFESLENRHVAMMSDLAVIEDRLSHLRVLIGGGT
ncbi:kinase-like protein [Rhizopogon vinicolor AM-OR11-026]|uniref:Kinase-like protein n=1 Tax=Rhizopogon vinicolor AM-OR11-026 TaxID=1314800 RepID=A0A1B7ND40_9AGAM|nr:kinase-like protein [Rhizopogon vinicolor AM-OR11-026]